MSLNLREMKLVFSGEKFVGIDAAVVDKNESQVGTFQDIAARAIAAWEATLLKAGVPLPK